MAGNTPRGIRKRLNAAGEPRYQVRYLDPRSRRPIRLGRNVCDVPDAARGKSIQVRARQRSGPRCTPVRPRLGRTPLNRIWTQFSDSKRPAVSPKTWSGYTQHWEPRIKPRFGHVPVDEITRADVQAFVDGLTVGPWAKVSTLRLLRSILDVAHQDGRIHRNLLPASQRAAFPERERHRYLTAQEVQTLAVACGDQGDVVTVLAYTGLRWSELVGLRVKDVDLVARRLYVRRAAPEVEGHIVVGPRRPEPASEPSRCRKWWSTSSKTASLAARPTIPPSPPNGAMLRSNNWRRHTHWNDALKNTDLAPLTIHDLRHTYASLARKSGADLRYVQKTMATQHRPSPRTSTATLLRRARPGRNQPGSASRQRNSHREDRQEPDESNQPPSA